MENTKPKKQQSKQETDLEKSIDKDRTNGIGDYRPGKQRIVEAH